jgi:hypothetical protein
MFKGVERVGSNGIWTQGLIFARRALYSLSHTPSPFLALVIFPVESHVILPRADLRPHSSYLHLPHIAGITDMPPLPACLLRWGLTNFLPGLASDHDSPDLHLSHSWYYNVRHQAWLWHF